MQGSFAVRSCVRHCDSWPGRGLEKEELVKNIAGDLQDFITGGAEYLDFTRPPSIDCPMLFF